MDLLEKISVLRWVKTKYKININLVKRKLKEQEFEELVKYLSYLKEIGGVYDAKDVIQEFIQKKGIEYKPLKTYGDSVDFFLFKNTHPEEDGEVEVYFRHLLLGSGRKPIRSNVRSLKRVLKDQGYEISWGVPIDSVSFYKEPKVKIREDYELKLPDTGLKSFTSKCYPTKDINTWLDDPKIDFENEDGSINLTLNGRWKAHFTQRFIYLFEQSELPYLLKGQTRGQYKMTPETELLCHLAFRDIFQPMPLEEWVKVGMGHEGLSDDFVSELLSTFLDAISYNMKKVYLNSKVLDFKEENIFGWQAVLALHFVHEMIQKGQ